METPSRTTWRNELWSLSSTTGISSWPLSPSWRWLAWPSTATSWAVTEAEKELGGGTGKLKLRQVYDLFVTRFPWLAKIVSFELFSDMVDDALDEMREMLANNQAVKALVNGEGAQNE